MMNKLIEETRSYINEEALSERDKKQLIYANPYDIVDMIKREVPNFKPVDEFKYIDSEIPEIVNIKDIIRFDGEYDEVRKFHMSDRGAMFGNYTMEEWYELLLSIAKNGLYEPIIVDKQRRTIVEGNHRIQAMKQLGYKQIPVRYINKGEK